jgi:MFS family permease
VLDSVLALGVAVLLIVGFREERQGPRDTRRVREMLLALPGALRAAPPILPLYSVQLLVFLGVQMSTPFVPLLVSELHTGDDLPLAIGVTMTSFGVATALFTAVWGRLGDRLGRLRMLQVAVVLSSLALVAQALAPNLPSLIAARTLQGVFQAAAAPLVVALVAAATPEAIRASVLNLSSFPFYIGSILGGGLGGLVAARSLQAVFLASAAGTLLASGVLARLRATRRLGQASDTAGAGG